MSNNIKWKANKNQISTMKETYKYRKKLLLELKRLSEKTDFNTELKLAYGDLVCNIEKLVKDLYAEIEIAKKDEAFNHDQRQYYRGKRIAFSQVISKLQWFGIVGGEESK